MDAVRGLGRAASSSGAGAGGQPTDSSVSAPLVSPAVGSLSPPQMALPHVPGTVLLWLRRDLRVADNPALLAALQTAAVVVRLLPFRHTMGGCVMAPAARPKVACGALASTVGAVSSVHYQGSKPA